MNIEIVGIVVIGSVVLSLTAVIMLAVLLGSKHWSKESYDKIGAFESDVKARLNDIPTKLADVNSAIKESTAGLNYVKDDVTRKLIDFQTNVGENINNMAVRLDTLTNNISTSLSHTQENVNKSLEKIQKSNENKLDEIRATVDDKLNDTLTKRINESFKTVSDNLIAVSKELGSVQNIVKDVGSIKQIFSNAKQKGMFGEYELEILLSDMLAPNQYVKDARINPAKSSKIVEFALKVPKKTENGKNDFTYMPVDSKFPTADYEKLLEDYDFGDKEVIKKDRKKLSDKIKSYASDIREKYIEPPYTTEVGLMFLPSEALYAEVLRINGLFQEIQKIYNVTIVSPTTLSAFLYTLQMNYRSLAVESETQKIVGLLGNVRNSFADFNKFIRIAKGHINNANTNLENAEKESRKTFDKLSEIDNFAIEAKKDIKKIEASDELF